MPPRLNSIHTKPKYHYHAYPWLKFLAHNCNKFLLVIPYVSESNIAVIIMCRKRAFAWELRAAV